MQKKVKNKIQENSGVTILLSLLVLLVVSFVAVVLLLASNTSVKNVSTTQESIQEGVTLDSAALFLKDNIKDSDDSRYIFNRNEWDNSITPSHLSTGLFATELNDIGNAIANGNTTLTNENAFTIKVENMDDVKAQYQLTQPDAQDNPNDYLLIFTLKTEHKTTYVHFNVNLQMNGNQGTVSFSFDRMYGKGN